jgi:hypothetical protein
VRSSGSIVTKTVVLALRNVTPADDGCMPRDAGVCSNSEGPSSDATAGSSLRSMPAAPFAVRQIVLLVDGFEALMADRFKVA